MLRPGTRENDLMNADIDAIAVVFKRWEAQGLVILWRPLHEMNGAWFWWGQKTQYPALWDALFARDQTVTLDELPAQLRATCPGKLR
ncbi:glycosyl hydrolase [Asticcacaulis sp. AC402]|uniref:glycosyl hydrolase n=1 Tax=Asticcacaulis sp. AC402 TaxID=1282361 RepID=UPI0003C3ED67|nr:glycosyl hydrolase [Asticcacaulis sp. AC402]ESQ75945.1 hypothetical protein ABAC402_05745 [Asticcacaulis sp. AC402]